MDKVLSQDGVVAPAQGSLMLSPPYEVRHTALCSADGLHNTSPTSFLSLYQSAPNMGTPHN